MLDPTAGLSPGGDLDGIGESWEVRSLLPASDCQWKKEDEEAKGLEAFHLYLLRAAPAVDNAADLLGLASGSPLSCGFSTCSAVSRGALHTFSCTHALGLRALLVARGLFAEAATHL